MAYALMSYGFFFCLRHSLLTILIALNIFLIKKKAEENRKSINVWRRLTFQPEDCSSDQGSSKDCSILYPWMRSQFGKWIDK